MTMISYSIFKVRFMHIGYYTRNSRSCKLRELICHNPYVTIQPCSRGNGRAELLLFKDFLQQYAIVNDPDIISQ